MTKYSFNFYPWHGVFATGPKELYAVDRKPRRRRKPTGWGVFVTMVEKRKL